MALALTDALNGAANHFHFSELKTFAAAFLLAVFPSKSHGAQAVPALVQEGYQEGYKGYVDIDPEEQPTHAMVYRRDI